MHQADKSVLRLATGVGISVLVAYGMELKAPFVACLLTVILLAKPGPPIPLIKGLVLGAVLAALLTGGVLLVPLLQHYPAAAVLLTAAVLYIVLFKEALKHNPLTSFVVVAISVIPPAGVMDQRLAISLSQTIGVGLAVGVAVSAASHAFFPDPPDAVNSRAAPAGASPEAARWLAMRATLVIMPVYLLALINPALYISAVMKAVSLGQQTGTADARSAGRELVGATLMGAWLASLVWFGLTLRPNLWMLMLWIVAVAFWAGTRLFRIRPTQVTPYFWEYSLVTMFILLGPAIEDAMLLDDVYTASLIRVSLFIAVSLYAWAMVWTLDRWRALRLASPS